MAKVPEKINIRVNEKQYKKIKENADNASLTVSAFLKTVGQGFIPQSKQNHEDLREMIKIASDLTRLGNLQKMALQNDQHWREVGAHTITELYNQIEKTRSLLLEKIKEL